MAMEGCQEFMLFGKRIVVDSNGKTTSLNNVSEHQHAANAASPTAKAAVSEYASDSVLRIRARRERNRGTPWTEDEHKGFLMGLKKFGKGNWREIAYKFVRTRTPMQVASHAQKYFLRHTTVRNRSRRRSVFDITTETLNCEVTGKTTEDKSESASEDSALSQARTHLPTTGSSMSPVALAAVPITVAYPLASSIALEVTDEQQMTFHPPAPRTLQLFPSSNSNSAMNYSPLPPNLCLALPSHHRSQQIQHSGEMQV